jgi:hypothetical protein
MQPAVRMDLQLQQLRWVLLAKAELGAAALQSADALCLKLGQDFRSHEERPGVLEEERPKAPCGRSHQRTELASWAKLRTGRRD